jgi:hypothetical protein
MSIKALYFPSNRVQLLFLWVARQVYLRKHLEKSLSQFKFQNVSRMEAENPQSKSELWTQLRFASRTNHQQCPSLEHLWVLRCRTKKIWKDQKLLSRILILAVRRPYLQKNNHWHQATTWSQVALTCWQYSKAVQMSQQRRHRLE